MSPLAHSLNEQTHNNNNDIIISDEMTFNEIPLRMDHQRKHISYECVNCCNDLKEPNKRTFFPSKSLAEKGVQASLTPVTGHICTGLIPA